MNKYFNPTPFYLIYNGEFFCVCVRIRDVLQCFTSARETGFLKVVMCVKAGRRMLGWLLLTNFWFNFKDVSVWLPIVKEADKKVFQFLLRASADKFFSMTTLDCSRKLSFCNEHIKAQSLHWNAMKTKSQTKNFPIFYT